MLDPNAEFAKEILDRQLHDSAAHQPGLSCKRRDLSIHPPVCEGQGWGRESSPGLCRGTDFVSCGWKMFAYVFVISLRSLSSLEQGKQSRGPHLESTCLPTVAGQRTCECFKMEIPQSQMEP